MEYGKEPSNSSSEITRRRDSAIASISSRLELPSVRAGTTSEAPDKCRPLKAKFMLRIEGEASVQYNI
ncbi:hypothetical protein Trydic_g4009 [Trypoxylus dichotomus]